MGRLVPRSTWIEVKSGVDPSGRPEYPFEPRRDRSVAEPVIFLDLRNIPPQIVYSHAPLVANGGEVDGLVRHQNDERSDRPADPSLPELLQFVVHEVILAPSVTARRPNR